MRERRDRVERRARLVHEDHLGLDGDGAGDAQALLLAAGEARRRRCLSLSLTSSHSAARRSAALDDVVSSALHAVDLAARRRRCRRSTSGTGWASGTPCRCAGGPRPGRRRARRGPGRGTRALPSTRAPGMRSFIRLRQRRKVDLAAARRADQGGDLVAADVDRDVAGQRLELAVEEVELAARKTTRAGRRARCGRRLGRVDRGRRRATASGVSWSVRSWTVVVGQAVSLPASAELVAQEDRDRRSSGSASPSRTMMPAAASSWKAACGRSAQSKIWRGIANSGVSFDLQRVEARQLGAEGHAADHDQRGRLADRARQGEDRAGEHPREARRARSGARRRATGWRRAPSRPARSRPAPPGSPRGWR